MKTKFYIAFICVLSYVGMHAQNSCNNPIQLCFSNNSSISFPAATSGTAQVGPAYGCLTSQPAPTWFYIKTNAAITNSVTQFVISSSSNLNAIVWGPSPSNTAFCSIISNATNIVDCSFSPAISETLTIPNTQSSQFYIIMVTNNSGTTQNINIACTQGGNNIFCPPGSPNADFSMQNSIICQGQSVPLTDLSAPSGSISSWNYNCPAASPPSSTFQNPTFTFNAPGTHTISLTVAASGSLTSTITKTIQVNPLPILNITPSNPTICLGQTINLIASGAFSYNWSSGSTASNITVSPTATTSYSVVGINSFGCQNSTSIAINVINTPIVSINSPSTSVCFGYTMSVIASGASNYSWSTGSTSNSTTIQPISNSNYSVVGTNAAGCSDTAYLPITVLPLPSVSASVSSTIVCLGESVDLTGSGNAVTYYWQPINLFGQNHIVQVVAPTTYTLYGQGSNGCAFLSNVFVDVYNSTTVVPKSTPSEICAGDSSRLSVIGGTVPLWGSNPVPNTIMVTPINSTNYTVNVLDTNGCNLNVTFTVDINPNCDITIYSGFTPNGDGINDFFVIDNIDKFPNNHVHIFNRWGNKIISILSYNNASNRWDGKENGKPLTSGTYFYLITNDNDKLLKKGWIELTN